MAVKWKTEWKREEGEKEGRNRGKEGTLKEKSAAAGNAFTGSGKFLVRCVIR